MGLKRLFIGVCLTVLCTAMWGEESFTDRNGKSPTEKQSDCTINFGAKGGFTSSLSFISAFNINGTDIDEVQNNYKIGYFASIFMRINFDRHFLQPEISYNINRGNITFEKPQSGNTIAGSIHQEASITSKIHSIDFPILYGYNIIKEGPYSLAIFGGPKIRYIWDKKSEITFDNFDQTNIREKLRPLNLSFTVGTSVTISRIFFDFRYDIGLHNISKHVTCEVPNNSLEAETATNEIRFHRTDNVLSFSFGVFF